MTMKSIDPIKERLVETGASLGTGINEKKSTFFSIRR